MILAGIFTTTNTALDYSRMSAKFRLSTIDTENQRARKMLADIHINFSTSYHQLLGTKDEAYLRLEEGRMKNAEIDRLDRDRQLELQQLTQELWPGFLKRKKRAEIVAAHQQPFLQLDYYSREDHVSRERLKVLANPENDSFSVRMQKKWVRDQYDPDAFTGWGQWTERSCGGWTSNYKFSKEAALEILNHALRDHRQAIKDKNPALDRRAKWVLAAVFVVAAASVTAKHIVNDSPNQKTGIKAPDQELPKPQDPKLEPER